MRHPLLCLSLALALPALSGCTREGVEVYGDATITDAVADATLGAHGVTFRGSFAVAFHVVGYDLYPADDDVGVWIESLDISHAYGGAPLSTLSSLTCPESFPQPANRTSPMTCQFLATSGVAPADMLAWLEDTPHVLMGKMYVSGYDTELTIQAAPICLRYEGQPVGCEEPVH
jgi:hypothetical protein